MMVNKKSGITEPVVVSWSGGKDSCFALHSIKQQMSFEIRALITTITEDYDRISMHGVRRVLLERQADSLVLPLHEVLISKDATNREYETKFAQALTAYKAQGIDSIVFGDLFLEDVRAYREELLARFQMKGIFPVWHIKTDEFIRDFITAGYKAVVTCVNAEVLDESFAGRMIDHEFLEQLPVSIDPCGENGEFHSFVFDGPLFTHPVRFALGETVRRGGFWFRDLIPV